MNGESSQSQTQNRIRPSLIKDQSEGQTPNQMMEMIELIGSLKPNINKFE